MAFPKHRRTPPESGVRADKAARKPQETISTKHTIGSTALHRAIVGHLAHRCKQHAEAMENPTPAQAEFPLKAFAVSDASGVSVHLTPDQREYLYEARVERRGGTVYDPSVIELAEPLYQLFEIAPDGTAKPQGHPVGLQLAGSAAAYRCAYGAMIEVRKVVEVRVDIFTTVPTATLIEGMQKLQAYELGDWQNPRSRIRKQAMQRHQAEHAALLANDGKLTALRAAGGAA